MAPVGVERHRQIVAHRRQVLVVMLHDGAHRIPGERHARRRAPAERGDTEDVRVRSALESRERMVVAVEVAVARLDHVDHAIVQHHRPDAQHLLREALVCEGG